MKINHVKLSDCYEIFKTLGNQNVGYKEFPGHSVDQFPTVPET